MKTYDVAIIGAGVIGSSIAFELAAEKLRVAVFDRQRPGQEASWAAAGMLSPAPDSPRDIPLAPLSCESLRLYPEFVAAVEETSGRSVGYERQGAFELFFGAQAEDECDRRVSQCKQLGITIEALARGATPDWEDGIGRQARAAAWLPEEGRVEPRLLTKALLLAARRRAVEVQGECAVTDLLIQHDRCIGLVAGGEEISAGQVIVSAGCFSGQIGGSAQVLGRYAPTRPVRGQMLALQPDEFSPKRVLRTENGYLVPRRDGRVVAGSTSEDAGFEKRVTPQGINKILDTALKLLPSLSGAAIVETWSGLRPGTPDDLPILGPLDIEGLLIATGHYRNGILLAAITAKLVREWVVLGRTSFSVERFSPLRFAKHPLTGRRPVLSVGR